SVSDWEDKIEKSDTVVGMRFHGNTVALANGVPSIYLVNDTRIHELALHFGIPYYDIRDSVAAPDVKMLIENADFDRFNALYRHRYETFATYLEANGLEHKMVSRGRVGRGRSPDVPPLYDARIQLDIDPTRELGWLREQYAWASQRVERLQQQAARDHAKAAVTAQAEPNHTPPVPSFDRPTTTDIDVTTNLEWNRERWGQVQGWREHDVFGYRWGGGRQQTVSELAAFTDQFLTPWLNGRHDLTILELAPGVVASLQS
ncbi:MAG TPA: polysaccharide pyruvyl transferase family protein, partial [Thermomicrobiales bacterium]|nr:polysaccharide pyruvyl transferase family protein [Thermomicrobiales bacterium]